MTDLQIKNKILEHYPMAEVDISDMTGAGDHWRVNITSDLFKGLSRVEQHQKIMDLFSAEFKSRELHAFSLKIKTQA